MTISLRVTKRRTLLALGVVALVAAGAALAFTVFSSGSSGRGLVANAHTAPTFTTPGGGTGTDCEAGATCGLRVAVSNPNAFALTLTAVDYGAQTFTIEKPIGTVNAGCPTSNFTKNTLTGLSINIAPGSSEIVIPGAYSLSASAPVACAGSIVFIGKGVDTTSYSTKPAGAP
jgi:hypothetical protein